MTRLDHLLDELVTANHILAHENVVDSFGHISCRHPERADRFLMARARAPNMVEPADIMEFDLEGVAIDADGRMPYLERFIHAAVLAARPDVDAVVHNHSHAVIPFGVTDTRPQAITNQAAVIGREVPLWDSRTRFGDTNLLVSNMDMGRDLARTMAGNACCLMRGHGCVVAGGSIRSAVYVAIALVLNCELQLSSARLGPINFLTPGETDMVNTMMNELDGKPLAGRDRAWEYWCNLAGRPYRPPE